MSTSSSGCGQVRSATAFSPGSLSFLMVQGVTVLAMLRGVSYQF